MTSSSRSKVVSGSTLEAFAAGLLRAAGCPSDEAALVAASLVHADLRGVGSHGVLRLPHYLRSVAAGGLIPGAPMRWVRSRPAVATLDANAGFGQSAMARACDRGTELAATAGCATVAVIRSTHFGAGSMWAQRIAERGMLSLIVANSGLCMAPFGGADRQLGANPVTIGVPTAGRPVVLDMATSTTAYGKIMEARSQGVTIPAEWAIDSRGEPTTDPREAMRGALRPFGGHKGSGLAVMIEYLAAALPGALFSYQIVDMLVDPASQMGTGHLLIVLDPAAFGDVSEFDERVSQFEQRIATAAPAPGADGVLLPGQREAATAAQRQRDGIPLSERLITELQRAAESLGAAPLPMAREDG